jgi:hypothetical protein
MDITDSFALNVTPTYLSEYDPVLKECVYWSWNGKKKIRVANGSGFTSGAEFDTELEAWRYALGSYPSLLHKLADSPMITYRAAARRAELLLSLGQAGFDARVTTMHEQVIDLYWEAMNAMRATRTTRTPPKVLRVSTSKAVSWLEVRAKAETPMHREPVLFGVRCLPSPVEDNTWSIRLRMPSESNRAVLEAHQCFDVLVARLRDRGILVRDVQHGTCIDI